MRSTFNRRRLISTSWWRYSGRPTAQPLIRTGAHEPGLGGDDQTLRVGVKRLRDELLADIGPVGVGGIDEVHAELHGALQNTLRFFAILGRAPDTVTGKAHRADSPDGAR